MRQTRTGQSGRLLDDYINCQLLGPGLPGNQTLAEWWDEVVLTKSEALVHKALQMIDDRIERIAVIGTKGRTSMGGYGRRVIVKTSRHPKPVSLKSLGDGALRLFAAGLALANCSDGYLLIDEVENGIHHRLRQRFWDMIIRAALEYNVQVIASTHSYDCVLGFARAAAKIEFVEHALLRIERRHQALRAVEYTEEELQAVFEYKVEVR